MRHFTAEDLYRHRTITELKGSAGHGTLVFRVGRALKKTDGYQQRLWRLQEDGGPPRPLTSPDGMVSSAALDAEGKRLAFLRARGKKGLQVHLLALCEGGEAEPLTDTKLELASIEDWAPDGGSLLVLAAEGWTEDGEEPPGDGGRMPAVVTFLPYKADGKGIIVSKRTHLHRVDSSSGDLRALTHGDFDVRMAAFSPDGKRIAFVRNRTARQRHRDDLWLCDRDGGNERCLVDALASISHVAWSPDGRRIALLGVQEEGDGIAQLWLVNPEGGDPVRVLDEDFQVDASGGAHWHPSGERIVLVSTHRSLRVPAIVDVTARRATRIDVGLRRISQLVPWGTRLACVAASHRKLEEVYRFEWDAPELERQTRFNLGWFARRHRPRVRLRQFRVPDGDGGEERIHAWVLVPADREPPYPLFVDMHGGPHSDVLIDFASHTYWYDLVSRGWAIVAPNAVGSQGYGQAFARRLRGRWGELDLPQFEAVIAALQAEGTADARVVCGGKSYGGFLAAWAAGHSRTFRAAIVAAPVSNLGSHFGTSDTGYYATPYLMAGEYHDCKERYDALSPVNYCRDVEAAVLILQGENDGRCPRGQGEELFAHLVRCSNAPAQMVVYPGSSHAEAESGRPSNRVDYHGRLADWAEQWAGEPGAA